MRNIKHYPAITDDRRWGYLRDTDTITANSVSLIIVKKTVIFYKSPEKTLRQIMDAYTVIARHDGETD